LKSVGEALGSSGTMERVLDAIPQATVEATEADRAVVFLLQDGRLVPMASAGAAPGSIDGLASTAEAVIERKIPAAVALKNTRELECLRSGGLGALGRMAAQVAHDLRNPLGGLKLFAEYLEHRLGKAIARTVVEQHGGRMDIRSQLGRGTQARVLLPLGAP
jgi:signal transduction histidine kinase